MSIFERKTIAEYYRPDVQAGFSFGEQIDIFRNRETHFTTQGDTETVLQAHRNRLQQLQELNIDLPEDYMDPYEYNPQEMIEYMGGYEALGQKYAGSLVPMVQEFQKIMNDKLDSLVLNARIEDPQNKKLLDIAATEEERKEEQKNVVLNNNLLAAQVSEDPNYSFTAELLGTGQAQFEDPVTIASLLIPGVSYAKLGTTFLRRLAGFSLANASFNTVAELIQSEHAKKMISDLNINENNEQIKKELELYKVSIDPGITQEELRARLGYAFIGGFILSPVIGLPLELINRRAFQLQKIMDGNKKTLKEIDDAVSDANTEIFNQPLHVNLNISNRAFKDRYMSDELPKDLGITHTIKIMEKTNDLAFKRTVKKNWVEMEEIKDIDEMINLLEKEIKFTKNNVMLEDFDLKLPNNLKNARPRYNRQALDFESEVDKALYIVRNRKTLSKYDADYMSFLQKRYPKKTEQELRKMGDRVLTRIKTLSKGNPDEDIIVNTLYKSKDTVIRQEERKVAKASKFSKSDRAVLKELMQQKNFIGQSHNNNVKLFNIEYDANVGKYVLKSGYEKEVQSTALFKNINKNINSLKALGKEQGFDDNFFREVFNKYDKKLINIKSYQNELQQKLAKGDVEQNKKIVKKLKQIDADVNNMKSIFKHKANVTSKDYSYSEIATDILAKDYSKEKIIFDNLEDSVERYRLELIKLLDDEAYRGMNTNKKDFILKYEEDFVRQMIDNVPAKDAISRKLADNFRIAFNYARQEANKLGDEIAYFDNFFPQTHDRVKITKAFDTEFEPWKAYIKTKLDLEETARRYEIDVSKPNWENILDQNLKRTHQRILTGDVFRSLKTQQSGQHFLKNNHTRYLIFKDGQSFLDYQKKLGKPSLRSGIDYLNHMATHIALLKRFGPRNFEGAKLVDDFAKAADSLKNMKPKLMSTKFENILDYITGHENLPVTHKLFSSRLTGEVNLADFSKGTRALLQASQLGGAAIMAVADQAYGVLARQTNGMKLSTQFNSFAKTLTEEKGYMAKAGVSLEYLTNDIYNNSRLLGETMDDGLMSKLSQKLLKYSGLIDMTEMAQNGFKYDFQNHITKLADTDWARIDKNSKFMLGVYGINKNDFAVLKTTKRMTAPNGKDKFVRVIDIPDETVRQKFITYMNGETAIAVPTKTARARAFMMAGTKRGTGSGELARSFWLYKNFPMSIIYTQLARTMMLKRNQGLHAGASYFAQMMIMTSVVGAMLYNVKRVVAGKDPEPWSVRTLGLGAMYGGGLGIFGDFLLHDSTMYGRNIVTSFAGPVAGLINDTSKLLLGDFHQALFGVQDDMPSKFPTRLVDFLNRYTPFTNLWYTKLAKERLIVDQIKEAIDPDFYSKAKREQTRELKYGSGLWWQRGSMYPGRLDIGKFLELKD